MCARSHDLGQLAGAEADAVEPVEPHERRRGVDRIHDIVQRAGERVDILPIDRRDKGPVEPLNDLVGQEITFVLDFLDLVGFVPVGAIRRQHLLEEAGAFFQLVRQRQKVAVELLFLRNPPKCHP
jgi:hypothetical protein